MPQDPQAQERFIVNQGHDDNYLSGTKHVFKSEDPLRQAVEINFFYPRHMLEDFPRRHRICEGQAHLYQVYNVCTTINWQSRFWGRLHRWDLQDAEWEQLYQYHLDYIEVEKGNHPDNEEAELYYSLLLDGLAKAYKDCVQKRYRALIRVQAHLGNEGLITFCQKLMLSMHPDKNQQAPNSILNLNDECRQVHFTVLKKLLAELKEINKKVEITKIKEQEPLKAFKDWLFEKADDPVFADNQSIQFARDWIKSLDQTPGQYVLRARLVENYIWLPQDYSKRKDGALALVPTLSAEQQQKRYAEEFLDVFMRAWERKKITQKDFEEDRVHPLIWQVILKRGISAEKGPDEIFTAFYEDQLAKGLVPKRPSSEDFEHTANFLPYPYTKEEYNNLYLLAMEGDYQPMDKASDEITTVLQHNGKEKQKIEEKVTAANILFHQAATYPWLIEGFFWTKKHFYSEFEALAEEKPEYILTEEEQLFLATHGLWKLVPKEEGKPTYEKLLANDILGLRPLAFELMIDELRSNRTSLNHMEFIDEALHRDSGLFNLIHTDLINPLENLFSKICTEEEARDPESKEDDLLSVRADQLAIVANEIVQLIHKEIRAFLAKSADVDRKKFDPLCNNMKNKLYKKIVSKLDTLAGLKEIGQHRNKIGHYLKSIAVAASISLTVVGALLWLSRDFRYWYDKTFVYTKTKSEVLNIKDHVLKSQKKAQSMDNKNTLLCRFPSLTLWFNPEVEKRLKKETQQEEKEEKKRAIHKNKLARKEAEEERKWQEEHKKEYGREFHLPNWW